MNFLALLSAPESLLDFKLSARGPSPLPTASHPAEPSAFRKVTAPEDYTSFPGPSPSIDAIMQQRQQLINQFLQLNIQMLEKEINHETAYPHPAPSPHNCLPEDTVPVGEGKTLQKKIKKANHCGHEERPHYAKGMCSNCYHRHGRVKRPWNCPHEKLYAAGLCQNCYINDYNRRRREDGKAEEKIEVEHGLTMEGNNSMGNSGNAQQ